MPEVKVDGQTIADDRIYATLPYLPGTASRASSSARSFSG